MTSFSRDAYQAVYPRAFVEQLNELGSQQKDLVDRAAERLERFPWMGRESAVACSALPFPLREFSIPELHQVLFYSVEEERRLVLCWYLWDTRRNPRDMFTGFYVY